MKKQKTFYGDYAWGEVTDYLTHLKNIFTINSVRIKTSEYQEYWSKKTKIKVVVNFK